MKLKSMIFIFLCTFNLMVSSLKANPCQFIYELMLEDYLANMEQELYPCSNEVVVIDGRVFHGVGDCEMVDVSNIRALQQRTNNLLSTMEEPNDRCSREPYKLLQELTPRVDALTEELMELERERMTASGRNTIGVEISNILTQLRSIIQAARAGENEEAEESGKIGEVEENRRT